MQSDFLKKSSTWMGQCNNYIIYNIIQGQTMIVEVKQKQLRQEPMLLISQDIKDSQIHDENTDKLIVNVLKKQLLVSQLSCKAPQQRTEKDCRSLGQLLKNQPYFHSIAKNNRTLMDICSWIQYKKAIEGQYIYRINDNSQCFYIIIKGEVHLTCPEKQIEQDDEEKDKIEESFISQPNSKVLSQSSIYTAAAPVLVKNYSKPETTAPNKRLGRMNSILQTLRENAKQKKPIYLEGIVRVVVSGECFGDLGNANKRGTNAVAKQMTHLLVIRRQNYNVISHAQLISQNKRKYDFLSSIPLFLLLHRFTVQSILYFLEEVKVGYNKCIYNQGDNLEYVFIIYKGQFKLYKKISNKKIKSDTQYQLDIQQKRISNRKFPFKTIQLGQILGMTEAYNKFEQYQETCICKSQDGIILRIDKKKFLKKILSVDNNVDEIIKQMAYKTQEKQKQFESFMTKQQNERLYVQYLHTPPVKSRRTATVSSSQRERYYDKQTLRRLSDCNDNFFNRFNKTVRHQTRQTKISINRSLQGKQVTRQKVPSRIKDIVQMVDHQTNYYKIRKPKLKNVMLFEFNISKVPLHVKKKYQALFKKTK